MNDDHFNLITGEEATWASVVTVPEVQIVAIHATELVSILFAWVETLVIVTPPVEALWLVDELRVLRHCDGGDTKLRTFRDMDAVGEGHRLAGVALEGYCDKLGIWLAFVVPLVS